LSRQARFSKIEGANQNDLRRNRARIAIFPDRRSCHPDLGPQAAVLLGIMLKERGNTSGARNAFQQAIDSGHPEWRPRGTINLGFPLEQQGDIAGARGTYEGALNYEEPHTSMALMLLGNMYTAQRDYRSAREFYQRAAVRGGRSPSPAVFLPPGVRT